MKNTTGSPDGSEVDHDWEVTIATYGRRQTVRSDVYLNHALYGEPDGPIGMDYFVWVLRRGTETIVVDTGFSAEGGAARGRDMLTHPRELWERLEVDPATGPTVVVTHAHYDHIGNLDIFDRSPVVIARREVEFWSGPLWDRTLFNHSVDRSSLDDLAAVVADGRAVQFDGSHEVAPGVAVIEVGGHTPGQSMVQVDTLDGRVLLTSDAMHYYEELEREMPFTSVVDLAGMYAGFTSIKDLQASGAVQHVVSGHDPSTISRFAPDFTPGQTITTIGRRDP